MNAKKKHDYLYYSSYFVQEAHNRDNANQNKSFQQFTMYNHSLRQNMGRENVMTQEEEKWYGEGYG